MKCSCCEESPAVFPCNQMQRKQILGHAVSLLGLHEARLVCVWHSERRVVLKRSEDGGTGVLPLVHKPDSRRDSHHSHHTENNQGGEQRIGF